MVSQHTGYALVPGRQALMLHAWKARQFSLIASWLVMWRARDSVSYIHVTLKPRGCSLNIIWLNRNGGILGMKSSHLVQVACFFLYTMIGSTDG